MFYDKQTVVHIAAKPVFHECMKHIETDIDSHLDRDKIQGVIRTLHVSSTHQVTDVLTKPPRILAFQISKNLISKMGLQNLNLPSWGC